MSYVNKRIILILCIATLQPLQSTTVKVVYDPDKISTYQRAWLALKSYNNQSFANPHDFTGGEDTQSNRSDEQALFGKPISNKRRKIKDSSLRISVVCETGDTPLEEFVLNVVEQIAPITPCGLCYRLRSYLIRCKAQDQLKKETVLLKLTDIQRGKLPDATWEVTVLTKHEQPDKKHLAAARALGLRPGQGKDYIEL